MSRYTKREDGRYQYSITIGRNTNGTPKRKYLYGATIKELREKISLYEENLRAGRLDDENSLFSAAAKTWIEEYKYVTSAKVHARYKRVIELHLAPLANYKLKDLRPLHLQSIINTMADNNYSKHTLKEVKQTASQILNMAVDNNLISRNPLETVKIPNIEPTVREPISDDVRKLIERTWRGHRMGIPVLLMLYCGLRKGELLALKWGDIHLTENYVNVTKSVYYISNQPCVKPPKTKESVRQIPLPDILIPVITDAAGDAEEYVCPSAQGQAMSEIAFRRAWQSYQHYLNIEAGGHDATRTKEKVIATEPFTAHQLRHTYATILYDANVDVLTAQRLLGHADVDTTLRIYTHLTKEKQRASLDALNASLKGKAL